MPAVRAAMQFSFHQAWLTYSATSCCAEGVCCVSCCGACSPNQLVTPRKKRVRNVTTTMTVSCAASGAQHSRRCGPAAHCWSRRGSLFMPGPQRVLCAVVNPLTVAPVLHAGRELDFKVTTGSRRTSALAFARTMIPVDSAGAPRCAMISAACSPARPAQIIGQAADAAATPAAGSADSTTTFVPLTPSNVDTSKTEAVGACTSMNWVALPTGLVSLHVARH